MRRSPIGLSSAVLFGLAFLATDFTAAQVIWDRAQIDRVRAEKPASDTPEGQAIGRLKKLADIELTTAPFSVTEKEIVPPSGDVHDYLSFSRYWWPDPDKPDGLPYIRKDGVVNRTLISNGDRGRLGDFCNAVQRLALAGYLLEDSRYSRHAAKLVRTWFLDESTRMNPNLNFGQGVPGRATGRGPGIIDTRGFILVLDAVELFDASTWSADDQQNLQTWFDEYQNWLKDSPLGQHEERAMNNHGSWYAAQRARYALFAGKEDVAREILADAETRIGEQFDGDGNQAAELKRTLSLHYCLFNLTALSRLARVGDQLGEDIWGYTPDHGCGLRKGLDVLMPYLKTDGESEWPHEQIKPISISSSSHLTLRLFSQRFGDSSYSAAVAKNKFKHQENDFTLLVSGDADVATPSSKADDTALVPVAN